MKNKDQFDALEAVHKELDQDGLKERVPRRVLWMRCAAVAACALALLVAFLKSPFFKSKFGKEEASGQAGESFAVQAEYPEPVAEQMSVNEFYENDAHWDWWESYRKLTDRSSKLQPGLQGFYTSMMGQILGSGDDNIVCSPINLYIAFAMLAEVSDGETRQQVLDMLGSTDIETVRAQVDALWQSNYVDTPVLKSLLANSIWLDQSVGYNSETLQRLADQYHASSFSGTPGSAEMDEALRHWTDENTGNLLTEYTKDMKIAPDTVLEILSTIYYKATWQDVFLAQNTTQEVFHGTQGDSTVDMMHRSDMMGVYRTDKFSAISLNLMDSGSMVFYLPNEGIDVRALAADPEVFEATKPIENEAWSYPMVHLSLPKFKVTAKTDLIETIRALGVTDALDHTVSDFTPLTTEKDQLYVSKAEHAAMIEIDEEGVTGAAYTQLELAEGAAEPNEEIDFVVDRPFMFVVTSRDGSILFSGIVQNIQ